VDTLLDYLSRFTVRAAPLGFSRKPTRMTITLPEGSVYYPPTEVGVQRTLPSVRASLSAPSPLREGRYGNIDPFTIGYAVRLCLRSRLTLIRLALIRKPESFGVPFSRRHYRYLCLHFRFQELHQFLRTGFSAAGMLPYLPTKVGPIASVQHLMPDYHPCRIARLVSCYALVK